MLNPTDESGCSPSECGSCIFPMENTKIFLLLEVTVSREVRSCDPRPSAPTGLPASQCRSLHRPCNNHTLCPKVWLEMSDPSYPLGCLLIFSNTVSIRITRGTFKMLQEPDSNPEGPGLSQHQGTRSDSELHGLSRSRCGWRHCFSPSHHCPFALCWERFLLTEFLGHYLISSYGQWYFQCVTETF